MKIAFVSEFIYPFHKGGAEKRFYEIARRLACRGHEVHWFGMEHWSGHARKQYEEIHLHGVCEPLGMYTRDGRRSVATALRLSERLAVRVITSSRFDVIDCSLYPFFHILALRVFLPSTPMSVTWHEFWGEHWYSYLGRLGYFGKLVERLAAVAPQKIIAVSEMARDSLCTAGVPPRDIVIVRNGISYAEIRDVPPAEETSDVIYFGRLKNHKNVDVIIRSVAVLKRTRPDLKCLIIGDGPERQSLEASARQLGVAQNVHFTGIVEDSAALLGLAKASKVFVNPSTKEGGGSITLLEANACGLPVLAVRHKLGIDASLIMPGQNGYWVDALDPDLFAAAIDGLLADDARRNAKRHQCTEFASRFDWQNIALECEDVYAGLARKASLPSRARQALRRLFSSPRPHDLKASGSTAILQPGNTMSDDHFIPMAVPVLGEKEAAYVLDAVRTGWISSQGRYVTEFEDGFSKYCSAAHGVAVTSGTTALHLALAVLGAGLGDEVILPPVTHIACINAVRLVGATPVLADCDPTTWGLSPAAVKDKITARTRVIMPVHLYGHPVDLDPLLELAQERGIYIVEDAAEAHGAEYKGKRIGSLGHLTCFSFYANKIITTGEGGMIVTNDAKLAARARKLRDQAYEKERRFWHTEMGFNYRFTNVQAGIGLAQLERITEFVETRRRNAQFMNELLRDEPGITLPPEQPWAKNVYWMYSVLIDPETFGMGRDGLMSELKQHGIDSRPFFFPLHQQALYQKDFQGERYPVAENLSQTGINLPSGNELTEVHIRRIAEAIKGARRGRF